MATLTMGTHGEISLPKDLCQRFKLKPATAIRVLETRHGILLIPLSKEPMSAALQEELREWQSLSCLSWDNFSFEE